MSTISAIYLLVSIVCYMPEHMANCIAEPVNQEAYPTEKICEAYKEMIIDSHTLLCVKTFKTGAHITNQPEKKP